MTEFLKTGYRIYQTLAVILLTGALLLILISLGFDTSTKDPQGTAVISHIAPDTGLIHLSGIRGRDKLRITDQLAGTDWVPHTRPGDPCAADIQQLFRQIRKAPVAFRFGTEPGLYLYTETGPPHAQTGLLNQDLQAIINRHHPPTDPLRSPP
ncbi:MAG: hypothetical protein AAFP10_08795 [Pseudomonadota bacterium]